MRKILIIYSTVSLKLLFLIFRTPLGMFQVIYYYYLNNNDNKSLWNLTIRTFQTTHKTSSHSSIKFGIWETNKYVSWGLVGSFMLLVVLCTFFRVYYSIGHNW